MDPVTGAALINVGGGLIGSLLGGKKKNPYEEAAARAANQQTKISDMILKMAQGYDPSQETQGAVNFAQDSAARMLANSQGQLNQRFKLSGGSPTGDTNFGFMSQRATDSVLNPLAAFAAERKAGEFARRLAAFQAAMGAGGQAFGAQASMMNSYQPYDNSGAQMQLATGIGQLLPKQKTPNEAAGGSQTNTWGGVPYKR